MYCLFLRAVFAIPSHIAFTHFAFCNKIIGKTIDDNGETKMTKNFKKFLLLWSGELISSVGGGLTSFGLTVYVFGLTGSAASTALIALLAFLPNLLLGVPAGVLTDRIDRRLLMMLGDGLSAIGLNLLKIYCFIILFA